MIFVDTSAWFALYDPRDANHKAALHTVRSIVEPLVTTDFVVAETLTLFRARDTNRRAIEFGKQILEAGTTTLVRIHLHHYLEESIRIRRPLPAVRHGDHTALKGRLNSDNDGRKGLRCSLHWRRSRNAENLRGYGA